MRVTKPKALISFAVTAKLICVFVFAYAKSRFSHNEAHIISAFALFNIKFFYNHSDISSRSYVSDKKMHVLV